MNKKIDVFQNKILMLTKFPQKVCTKLNFIYLFVCSVSSPENYFVLCQYSSSTLYTSRHLVDKANIVNVFRYPE